MAELLVIIPSRGRPHAIADLLTAWHETTAGNGTRLLVCLDNDDPTAGQYPTDPAVSYEVGPRDGFAPRLNSTAKAHADEHFALASWGDDHRPRTAGWDLEVLRALRELRHGFAYGDDLLAGVALPTAVHVTSSIVQAIGYLTPPGFAHLFVDNVWHWLGETAHCLTWLPDVVIEHMHPAAGKGEWDDLVREANTPAAYAADRAAFKVWLASSAAHDADVIKALRR